MPGKDNFKSSHFFLIYSRSGKSREILLRLLITLIYADWLPQDNEYVGSFNLILSTRISGWKFPVVAALQDFLRFSISIISLLIPIREFLSSILLPRSHSWISIRERDLPVQGYPRIHEVFRVSFRYISHSLLPR